MKKQILLLVSLLLLSIYSTSAQSEIETFNADSLLLGAASVGDVQAIKKALNQGVNVNCVNSKGQTPLYLVAKLVRFDLVKLLIEKGANVNKAGNDKITPLHWAVEYNNTKIVGYLLKHGADVNARDGLYETPVHWSGWTGNIESAKLLLEYDGDPSAKNNGGVTPLDLARRQEHYKLAELFDNHIKNTGR